MRPDVNDRQKAKRNREHIPSRVTAGPVGIPRKRELSLNSVTCSFLQFMSCFSVSWTFSETSSDTELLETAQTFIRSHPWGGAPGPGLPRASQGTRGK